MGGSKGKYQKISEKSGSNPSSRKMADTRRKISPKVGQVLVWERGVRVFLLPTFGKRIASLCLFAMVKVQKFL